MSTATYRHFSSSAADAYETFFVPTIATPFAGELLRVAALRPGESVLDVACGTGVISRLAASSVGDRGRVVGVDIAPDMIEVAAAGAQAHGAAIEWHQADAVSLPFPDRSFDAALCQLGLMFMEDREGVVAEMHRVLEPGGRVIVNTPGRIQPVFEHLEQAIVDHVDPDLGGFVRAVFSLHDPDELRTLVAAGGFDDATASRYEVQLSLPAPTELLWRYIGITPLAELVGRATDDAKAAMEAQFVESCSSLVVEGRIPLVQPAVLVHGRRPGR